MSNLKEMKNKKNVTEKYMFIIWSNIHYIYVFILILYTSVNSNYLKAQTLGDIRACFDIDLQDTIVWFDLCNECALGKTLPQYHSANIAYIVFEKNNTIHLEKWCAILDIPPLDGCTNMRNIPEINWLNPTNKFYAIPPAVHTTVSDSMIQEFNLFQDSVIILSEKTPMSNDWKRFIRKSVVTTAAVLYCFSELYHIQIRNDYYGRQILNVLLILRYMDCLLQKDFFDCQLGSFLMLRKFKNPNVPISVYTIEVYVNPTYMETFYQNTIFNLGHYIKKYPDYREFTSNMYMGLFSGLSHHDFDFQSPNIHYFERH